MNIHERTKLVLKAHDLLRHHYFNCYSEDMDAASKMAMRDVKGKSVSSLQRIIEVHSSPKPKRKVDAQLAELKDILQNRVIEQDESIWNHQKRIEQYGGERAFFGCIKWDEGFKEGVLFALGYINNLDA